MNWKIDFDSKAKKELLRLDKPLQRRIIKFLEERVLKKGSPRSTGSALQGSLSGLWRYIEWVTIGLFAKLRMLI